MFAATIFGSIIWAVGGAAAFVVAGVLWYLADIARDRE